MAVIDVGSYLPTFLTREDSFPYTYIPEPDRKLLRSRNCLPTFYVKIVLVAIYRDLVRVSKGFGELRSPIGVG